MFVNLTPHEVVIIGDDDLAHYVFPPSGQVARIEEEVITVGTVANGGITLPYAKTKLTAIIGRPAPNGQDTFIVSMPVAQALGQSRLDVMSPDSGPGSAVREDGQLMGVRRLRCFA